MTEKKTEKAKSESKDKAEPKNKAAPKKEVTAAAPKAAKPAASGKTVTLIQTGSPIGRQAYQRATLIGLGLNKINRTRTLQDSPSVRGMIETVKHLVKIVEAK